MWTYFELSFQFFQKRSHCQGNAQDLYIFWNFVNVKTSYLSLFSPNAGKYGKNADQNNSEYGHILRCVTFFIQILRRDTWYILIVYV